MAGWLLVTGALAFVVGAANPALGPVWSAAPGPQLRLINDAATAWTITNALFAVGTVLTAAGLWLVPERIGAAGKAAARAATVAYVLGAMAWLMSLTVRLAVTPGAAASFVGSGSLDPAYVLDDRWAHGLFGAFTWLAGGAIAVVGGAVIAGRTLRAATGWFALAAGLLIVLGYAIAGDMPPFVAFLPTGWLGLDLLRPRVPGLVPRPH